MTFTSDSRSIKLTLSYLYLLYNHLYSSDVKGLLAIFNPHLLQRCKAVITRLYKFSVKVCKSTFQIFIPGKLKFNKGTINMPVFDLYMVLMLRFRPGISVLDK